MFKSGKNYNELWIFTLYIDIFDEPMFPKMVYMPYSDSLEKQSF